METITSDTALSIGNARVTYRNQPLVLPPQQLQVLREAYMEGTSLERYIQFTEGERNFYRARNKNTTDADNKLRRMQAIIRLDQCGGEVRYNAATDQAYLRIAIVEREATEPGPVAAQAD